MKLVLVWLTAALAAFGAMPAGATDSDGVATRAVGVPIGARAPAFELPDTRGALHGLAELRGKIVVVNYWAFWCDTWRAELPHLERLAADRHGLDFDIVAVSVDGNRYDQFLDVTRNALPFRVLLDVGGRVSSAYGVRHVPTVVIVDAAGRVRYAHAGYPGNEAILSAVRRIESRPEGNAQVAIDRGLRPLPPPQAGSR